MSSKGGKSEECFRSVHLERPDGKATDKINVEYTYTARTTDPDGDDLYYLFDWDDGTYSGRVGPYASGEEANARHIWTVKGSFNIRVKVKDMHGVQSEWPDPLQIVMPISLKYHSQMSRLVLVIQKDMMKKYNGCIILLDDDTCDIVPIPPEHI